MIFRILFLVIFCLLSVSCSSKGSKSSSESTTTASQGTTAGTTAGTTEDKAEVETEGKVEGELESVQVAKEIDTQAKQTKLKESSKETGTELVRAKKTKSLELPPDLVGSANDKVQGNIDQSNVDPFSEIRVLPEIIGVKINKQGEKTWLEIDTNVELVWKTVSEYWVTKGVNLVDNSPEAGTMETEWIEKETAVDEESAAKKLFKSLLAAVNRNTARDKYRIRFERVSPNKTAMFVTHRATVKKAIESVKEVTTFEWVELPPDPEQVADFLQNIILIFDQSTST